jgi:hypothetical protein
MKKKTMQVISDREIEKNRSDWEETLNEYTVSIDADNCYTVMAHGYLIGENRWNDAHFLIFFLRIGDELVEVSRFKVWSSVIRHEDSLYREKLKRA